ncbi:hypothetical protein Y032_0135g1896 [Ancylostoma ceylanicum]|uniref:Uncharacterized protein n=1 Tax=Ancylostoma ceylanicum TaxID=53326 RepID=A0A016T4K9_9BILA|nr:hypothetical protein Y032_0135g1896 [Ancylostoma ceylanicum]
MVGNSVVTDSISTKETVYATLSTRAVHSGKQFPAGHCRAREDGNGAEEAEEAQKIWTSSKLIGVEKESNEWCGGGSEARAFSLDTLSMQDRMFQGAQVRT